MQQASASGRHEVGLKRVRRTWEPSFKTCGDEALSTPWPEIESISKESQYALANVCHFSHATYVQAEVVPLFSTSGTSVVVEAATGSGKTLAFVLPVMERLLGQSEAYYREFHRPLRSRRIVGAIFSPSRVLAQQTFIVARSVACRCTQVIRFVLCDLAIQPLETLVGHLGRASRIAGVVLVGIPADVERVRCALQGITPTIGKQTKTTKSSAAAVEEEEEDDDVDEAVDGDAKDGEAEVAAAMVAEDAIQHEVEEGAAGGGDDEYDVASMDEAERAMLRAALAKRAARREEQQHQQKKKASKTVGQTGDDAADTKAAVAPNPSNPFLVIVDEADVVMKSAAMRSTITALLRDVRGAGSTIDIGLFGATVGSAPQVAEFVSDLRLPVAPRSIVLGSNEQYVTKLTNRLVYTAGSDMLQTLIHLINAHPSKKHFVFFNSVAVLQHVKAVLAELMSGARPLVHTGRVFSLHEGMKDTKKFGEFARFLRYDGATELAERDAAKAAKSVKERRKIQANVAARAEAIRDSHNGSLEGFANGTKRTSSHIERATGAVLLCTDVAAFGLDVRDVEYVIHFEAPGTVRSYIHRIGRVARMGMRGLSTMLLPIAESNDATTEAMKQYAATLATAHAVQQTSVASINAPITPNIRSVVERSAALVESAKAAVPVMCSRGATQTDQTWFDPATAIDALTAGSGR